MMCGSRWGADERHAWYRTSNMENGDIPHYDVNSRDNLGLSTAELAGRLFACGLAQWDLHSALQGDSWLIEVKWIRRVFSQTKHMDYVQIGEATQHGARTGASVSGVRHIPWHMASSLSAVPLQPANDARRAAAAEAPLLRWRGGGNLLRPVRRQLPARSWWRNGTADRPLKQHAQRFAIHCVRL